MDVRDVARALIALALHGRPGQVYHVGTGDSRMRSVDGLEHLIAASGRSVVPRDDPGLMLRRPGPPDSRAAIDRIVAETGWEPRISFEQSLAISGGMSEIGSRSSPGGGARCACQRPTPPGSCH